MANDFAQGAMAAQETNKNNPFNLILGKFQEAQARRYKEDMERKKEEGELSKALQLLSYKDNYDKELLKATEEEKRKTGLLESIGKGEVTEASPEDMQGVFEGTPFGMVGKKYKATPKTTPVYLIDPTTGEMREANTGKSVDNASVPKGAKVISQPKEDPTMKTARMSRENLGGTIIKMESLLKEIPSKEGIAGRLSGLTQRAAAIGGYNEKLQTYNSFKQAILGQIVKVIGGETGSRLSDQDVKRMKGVLPSEFSTTKERALKLKLFKQMVNDTAVSYGAKPLFGNEGQQAQDNDPEYQKYLQAIGQ